MLPVTLDPRPGESLEYCSRLGELEPIVAELNAELDRREGCLSGQPLKLHVALDNLLGQLTRGELRVPAR